MPNKDSFTFSDKLRKSKSVPLSKRLPSIVGGQDKQKRTLVQRAQRDLPFILVAALALLLLPFLSRNGGDDSIPGPVSPWEQDATTTYVDAEGNEIMPNGTMRDPLDMIVGARSGIDSSSVVDGEATKNAYGATSGSDSSSRYNGYSSSSSTKRTPVKDDYQTRKSYEESYQSKTTKKPATSTYGKKTQAGVRKSFERKGTDINRALRLSQIPGGKGGSGLSHNLPIGEGPKRTPSNYNNPGVRPVALQPMEAKGGVGRSMTGENLYAEASRSIGAMNAGGPAKQNLLSAQMRDVDGKLTADGPGFGGPGLGASVRPGAGGNPSNTNGYHFDKPWWWSMMNERAQKMWELRYYKPREIFWNNLYNYGSQLMNCLATGDKGGDVSAMFGKKAGDDDWLCVDENGKEIMVPYSGEKTNKSKDKDGNTTEETANSNWFLVCDKLGGKTEKDPSSAKSFWKVRADCVGLGVMLDRMKKRIKHTHYDSNCIGVNGDPMSFSLDIERVNKKGKHNKKRESKLENKTVIALLAKVKEGDYNGKEIVVYAQQGNSLSSDGANFAADFNKKHNKCTLSRLVAFTSRKGSLNIEQKVSKYNAKEDTSRQVNIEVIGTTEDGLMLPSFSIVPEQGQVTAANKICNGNEANAKPLTLDDIRDKAELGKGKKLDEDDTRYTECSIWETKPDVSLRAINGKECNQYTEEHFDIKQTTSFESTIENSADKHVFAVLVDQIDQETDATVTYIVDFDKDSSWGSKQCGDNGTCHFSFNVNVASLGLNPNEYGKSVATNYTNANTARGSGIVFWIITGKNAELKVKRGDKIGQTLFDVNLGDLINTNQTAIYTLCRYRWCDDVATCPFLNNIGNSNCKDGNDLYTAHEVTIENKTYYLKIGTKLQDNPSADTLECNKLCYKDGQVYPCPNDTPEDQSICDTKDVKSLIDTVIKPCPTCCTYNYGNTYNGQSFKSVEIKGKHYIIDANPINSCNSGNTCTVAAWSEESNLFAVYDMGDLNTISYSSGTLPLTPDDTFKTATTNDSPAKTVNLSLVNQQYNTIFEETIKGQSEYNNDGPTKFELFPKLELSTDSDRNNLNTVDLSSCVFYGKALYENAYFEASHEDIQTISNRMRVCLKNIKKYEKAGATKSVEKLKNIYFYGYASKRGSHKAGYLTDSPYVGCTTSDADATKGLTDAIDEHWGDCNKALSEDRNLYIMNNVLEELRDDNLGIGVDTDSIIRFQPLKGFSDTKPENLTNENYRYTGKPQANGQEFIFISKPCGSVGAKYDYNASVDDARKDRYVLIAPIDSNGNECTNRMTIEGVTDALNGIAQEIAQEIQSAKKSKNSPTPSTLLIKVPEKSKDFKFGTENTGLVSRQEEEAIELTFSPDFKNMIKNFKDDVAKTNSTSLLDARSFSEATRILNNQKSAEGKLAANYIKINLQEVLGEEAYGKLLQILNTTKKE